VVATGTGPASVVARLARLLSGTPEDDGLTNDSLSVLYAFGEPVTFTATVSPNSPPASPEPVTHAGDLVVDSTGGGTAIFKEVTGLKCEISVIEFSPDQDNGLLLPAVLQTSAGGEDSWGLWQINVEPNQYNPDTFANDLHDSPTRPAVAMETLTIAHEGYWLI